MSGDQAKSTAHVPAPLRALKGFLGYKLEQIEGEPKPRKVPHYASGKRRKGRQGSAEDRAALTTLPTARDAAMRFGFDGIGFAPLPGFGIVALDFDNCVGPNGEIPKEVLAIAQQTYSEFSPSGKGIRSFFKGDVGNHKSPTKGHDFGFEVFSTTGYVTFTGNALPHVELLGMENTIEFVTQEVTDLCQARFGNDTHTHDLGDENDPLATFKPKLNLSLQEMETALTFLDPDMGRDEWLRVGMALHHECDGDDTGFALWNDWSAGGGKYPDEERLRADWDSFDRPRSHLRTVTMATVLRMAKEAKQLNRSRTNSRPKMDQLGIARATLEAIGEGNILFADGSLWLWDQRGVWRQVDDREIKQRLLNCAEIFLDRVAAATINGALDLLKSESLKPSHRFNVGAPEAVNCLNGELEYSDGKWSLAAHRRELYRTTQIPVAYDPSATAPHFSEFLSQIFRDDADRSSKIQTVLALLGYTLMSHTRLERFIILVGPGANGKSVVISVVEGLCGPQNIAGVQPSQFDRPFQRAHLHQKLANIITELKVGDILADAELKAITSGEPSTVEHKFGAPFELRPYCTCWFGTNHLPHSRDYSDALFRRAIIITFNRVFTQREQDPFLKDKLRAELPGILNLALNAYANAMLTGLMEPPSSVAAKREWKHEIDQVADFVSQCCRPESGGKIAFAEVYAAYESWTRSEGIQKTVTKRGFRGRLDHLGYGSARSAESRLVVGLAMKERTGQDFGLT